MEPVQFHVIIFYPWQIYDIFIFMQIFFLKQFYKQNEHSAGNIESKMTAVPEMMFRMN